MRFGTRIARVRGPIIASIASTSMLYVSGFDVDEHRHEPGADDRRDVGRERDRRRDDLVAGLQAEQLDREVQRRRARVAHHAAALAEQLGDALLRTRARSCRCAAPADRRAAPRRPRRSRARRGRCRRSRCAASSCLDGREHVGRHRVEHDGQLRDAEPVGLLAHRAAHDAAGDARRRLVRRPASRGCTRRRSPRRRAARRCARSCRGAAADTGCCAGARSASAITVSRPDTSARANSAHATVSVSVRHVKCTSSVSRPVEHVEVALVVVEPPLAEQVRHRGRDRSRDASPVTLENRTALHYCAATRPQPGDRPNEGAR